MWLNICCHTPQFYHYSSINDNQVIEYSIHLIPKRRPINYSFVYMLISPLCPVNMYKKQKNFEVKMKCDD